MVGDEDATRDADEREYAAALMARIRDGDERALAELMRAHTPKLGRIALAFVDRRELAVEVVQDTFVAFWEQRAAITDVSNIPGYLTRMVRNRALNVLKAERRYQRALDTAARTDTDQPAVAENAAEHALDEAERAQQFWHAVQHIPESPRRVLILHWYARMPYAEIATLLGVKVETVRKLMYRATTQLAQRDRGN